MYLILFSNLGICEQSHTQMYFPNSLEVRIKETTKNVKLFGSHSLVPSFNA